MLVVVSLGVDGSNAFAQRRVAQNAVDGGVTAGITTMSQIFNSNRYNTGGAARVHPITSAQGVTILQAITETLAANGVDTTRVINGGTFEAYYVDHAGQRYGTGTIGDGSTVPFADGNGPGSPGVQGIWIQSTRKSDTYFARVIGINTLSADAHSSAMLAGITGLGDLGTQGQGPKLWPITIFMGTINLQGTTTLYDFSTRYAPGNWGVLCYRGSNAAGMNCGDNQVNDWFQNGFNPGSPAPPDGGPVLQQENPSNRNLPGAIFNPGYFPVGNDGNPNHGNSTGVWVGVKPGNVVSSAQRIIEQAIREHWRVFVPISDSDNNDTGGNGRNLRYHVVNIAEFEVTGGSCCGSSNSIQGRFLGFNWNPAQIRQSRGLWPAVQNGESVIRLGP